MNILYKVRCARNGLLSKSRNVHNVVKVLLDDDSNLSRVGSLLSLIGFEEASSNTSKSATRYHHYELNIDLITNSQLGRFRRAMSKGKHFAHVLSIDLYPALINPHFNDEYDLGFIDLMSLSTVSSGGNSKKAIPMNAYNGCAETSPRFTRVSTSTVSTLGVIRPREIVVPIKGDDTIEISMKAFEAVNIKPLGNKHPGLWKSENRGDNIIYRLVPCTTLGLMLQVRCIDSAENYLNEHEIQYERLGNEMTQRELKVLDPSLSQAIDIRLSEKETPNLYWREGSSAVIDATNMQSLHNARVLAGKKAGESGEPDAEIDQRTLKQDCWVETRERVRSGNLR